MVSLEKDKSLNCSYSVLISTIKTCWIFECARTSLPQSGGVTRNGPLILNYRHKLQSKVLPGELS